MPNKKVFSIFMMVAVISATMLPTPLYAEIPKDRWSTFKNSAQITSLDGLSSLHLLFSCEDPGAAYLAEEIQLGDSYRSLDPKISSLPQSMVEFYKDRKINRTFVFGKAKIYDQGSRNAQYFPESLNLLLTSYVPTESQLIGMLRSGSSVEVHYYMVTGDVFRRSRYTLNNSNSSILEASICAY